MIVEELRELEVIFYKNEKLIKLFFDVMLYLVTFKVNNSRKFPSSVIIEMY